MHNSNKNSQDTPRPFSRKELRAILSIIKTAEEQQDIKVLDAVIDIIAPSLSNYPSHIIQFVRDYAIGVASHIEDPNENYYIQHSKEDLHEMERHLLKEAYGNFDDALQELTKDLLSISTNRSDSFLSDIFDTSLFSADNEGMVLWNNIRTFLKDNAKNPHSNGIDNFLEIEDRAEQLIGKIRQYQQRTYGPLLPVILATYTNRTGKGKSRGYSIKFIYDNPTLVIKTHAPFYEEIDDYFINRKPVESLRDFTPNMPPKNFSEYTLGDITEDRLFRYEIDN